MFKIGLNIADKQITPLISLDGESKYSLQQIAYVLYLMESGAYAIKLKELLSNKLNTKQMEQINKTANSLKGNFTPLVDKEKLQNKISKALIPLAEPMTKVMRVDNE